MFPPGLSMLWEDVDPTAALTERFGFRDLPAALEWLGDGLSEHWGLSMGGCERWLISDTNAIVWVDADAGPLVVKIASRATDFPRLAAVAELLRTLADAGLPVPAPPPARDGEARAELAQGDRSLSVLVLPLVEGELLDVGDLPAVRATGTALGCLHEALADVPPGPLHVPGRGADLPLRARLGQAVDRTSTNPEATARLTALLESLPDIDRAPQLTHGDIRSANVLIRDHTVAALLDFDDVGLDHRAVELGRAAVLLATQFRNWGPTPPPAQRALIDGYRSAVDLSATELGWLQATILATSLAMIPMGPDPTSWAAAADRVASGTYGVTRHE